MSDRERDSIQEMEDIQKGLEAFLQQELQGMQHTSGSGNGNRQTNRAQQGNRASDRSRQAAGRPAPQMFDLNEDDEDEEELDVIGSGRRAIQDDYGEDWDDPAYRKRQAARRAAARKTEKTSESSRRRQEAYKDEYDDYDEEEMREDRRSSGRKSKKQRERDEERDSRNAKSSRNNKKENGKKENGKKEPKKKKKSGFKRFLIAVALILVFLAAGLYVLVGKVYAEMNYEEIESVSSSPMKEEGVTNILLIGNDSRENGEDGRSDAMILLSIYVVEA